MVIDKMFLDCPMFNIKSKTVSITLFYFCILIFHQFIEMYNYIGCFKDRPGRRLLNAGPFNTGNNEMSINICFNHCNPENYVYFATEVYTMFANIRI